MCRPSAARQGRALLVVLLLSLLVGPVAVLAQGVQQEIFAQTAAIRGLQPKAPVEVMQVEPAALRQELLSSLEQPEAVQEVEISRKVLVLLGLVPSGTDLHALLVDLYAENILGYYNSDDKTMHIVSGRSAAGAEEKITLAHEFTHALQDQHFDLKALRKAAEQPADRATALLALIEGDATLVMLQYAQQHLSQAEFSELQAGGGASTLDRAPLVIRDELLFPYLQGLLFTLRLYQAGGYAAVDSAYADPPTSTEQIIHPEKYLRREAPVAVTVPNLAAALGAGWGELRSDVLGELDLRILLEQHTDPISAARGSEGWGGDRYVLLEDAAGRLALALDTAWDSEADAREFFTFYADALNRRFGQTAGAPEPGAERLAWSTPGGLWQLQRFGQRVLALSAPDQATLAALTTALAPGAPAQPAPAPRATPVPAPVQVPPR